MDRAAAVRGVAPDRIPRRTHRGVRVRPTGARGRAQSFAVACLLGLSGGCNENAAGEVRLVLGTSEDEQVTFEAKTALAEYVDLATGGAELRVTLASYPGLACQTFKPPGPGEHLVTVTITAPPGQAIREAEYPWTGSASSTAEASVDHPSSSAVPSARSSRGGHSIKPGGYVRLTKVELAPFGGVSGLLAFEYPGDVTSPATSIRGRFSARLCRFSPGGARSP